MMPAEALQALLALRDCGVIRASWRHPGYRMLRTFGLANYRSASGTDLFDFRLNDRGRRQADLMFRGER